MWQECEVAVPKLLCAALCTPQAHRPLCSGLRPGQRWAGPAGVSRAGCWVQSAQARFRWRQTRGLVAGLVLTEAGSGAGWSRSHPVPQDPALAAQLRGLVCRAPRPGITQVWLVSC